MPNWCSNTIVIRSTKENIQKVAKFLDEKNGKDWFDFFRPIPEEYKDGEKWYMWSVENWGCKWNCDAQDWALEEDGDAITFWFDSPWGPPTELYSFIANELGEDGEWNVSASWNEEGMQFVGEFVDGYAENYEYSDLDSLDDVPEHLVEEWGLRDMMLDRMESEEIDDEDEENE